MKKIQSNIIGFAISLTLLFLIVKTFFNSSPLISKAIIIGIILLVTMILLIIKERYMKE